MLTRNQIKQFVESHPELVSKKATSREGMYVLKYKNKVFYKNLWTPELLECRGTVIDEDYNIISRPFTKIFNKGENRTIINRDHIVTAVQKVNGFMCAVTVYKGELLVSTTGSIDSTFAELATKWVTPYENHFKNYKQNVTWIFEVCDVSDPHIIKEQEGLALLAIRENAWDSSNHSVGEHVLDLLAEGMGIRRPNHFKIRFSDLCHQVKTVKHEGFVCWDFVTELKMKSPYYLTTKFLSRMREDKLEKLLSTPNELKKLIDEEFYDIVDFINLNKESFFIMDGQEKVKFVRGYFDNRS
jgi:hypothetical protein